MDEIVQQIKDGDRRRQSSIVFTRGGNATRNLIGNEKTMLALLFWAYSLLNNICWIVLVSRALMLVPRWTRVMGRSLDGRDIWQFRLSYDMAENKRTGTNMRTLAHDPCSARNQCESEIPSQSNKCCCAKSKPETIMPTSCPILFGHRDLGLMRDVCELWEWA